MSKQKPNFIRTGPSSGTHTAVQVRYRGQTRSHAALRSPSLMVSMLFVLLCLLVGQSPTASAGQATGLASTPPMGWNDWAHYQCDYTAKTILQNARALVRRELAARGYDQVTIDDCWMMKSRNSRGDLQPNPKKFPVPQQNLWACSGSGSAPSL